MLKPRIKVSLVGEEVFFGPGIAELMEHIASTGSVKEACSAMGMSYSKAWKILNRMEKELNQPVVTRLRGGNQGGHTELTELGQHFLKQYRNYERQVKEFAGQALIEQMKLFQ